MSELCKGCNGVYVARVTQDYHCVGGQSESESGFIHVCQYEDGWRSRVFEKWIYMSEIYKGWQRRDFKLQQLA